MRIRAAPEGTRCDPRVDARPVAGGSVVERTRLRVAEEPDVTELMDRPNGGGDSSENDHHAARSAQPLHAAPSAPPPIAPSEVIGGCHAGTVRRSDESRLTRPPRGALSCRAVCHDPDSGPPIPPIAGASVSHDDLVLEAADGNGSRAFAAGPDAPARCGVVVLPDVRGLHHFYEELALRLGEQGIAAVAIDYFGRTAGVGKRDEDFPYAEHVPLTTGGGDPGRRRRCRLAPSITGGVPAVFTVGFCFGGRHSWLSTAGGHGLAGAIGFYGSTGPAERRAWPDPASRRAPARRSSRSWAAPTRRSRPTTSPRSTQPSPKPEVEHEVISYDGAPHSFFDRKQEQFADASADAWQRRARLPREAHARLTGAYFSVEPGCRATSPRTIRRMRVHVDTASGIGSGTASAAGSGSGSARR